MAVLSAVSAVHAALVPLATDQVTLTSPLGSKIKITNRDTSTPIYYRFDGTDPTVGGADCFVVLPGGSDTFSPSTLPVEVRLISAAAATYSVSSMA